MLTFSYGVHGQSKDKYEGSSSPYGCGEDSFFVTKDAIGIADGVGGWNDFGINPAFIARKMMFNAYNICQTGFKEPKKVLIDAHQKIVTDDEVFAGTTTCCILTLFDSQIHSANIGDSGYIVIRNGNIVHDNINWEVVNKGLYPAPNAIGIIPEHLMYGNVIISDPKDSNTESHPVQKGDIVVLATDGFWDNIKDISEIIQIITDLNSLDKSLKKIAKILVDEALSYYVKPDDITVVVARIENLNK
jgi:protein phosphatase PTC7